VAAKGRPPVVPEAGRRDPADCMSCRTSERSLEIEGLSDWDWIAGTSGKVTLEVRDGDRAPTEVVVDPFELEKLPALRRGPSL
jgi:hypothetical protein